MDIEDGANGTNGEIGKVFAGPWLDRDDRQAAPAALTPLLDVPRAHRVWVGPRPRPARTILLQACKHVADVVMTW